MSKRERPARPTAALPRGFRDSAGAEVRALRAMVQRISKVYEDYGFEPLETPAFEFTDALGKFLPDEDRPNEGVFSLSDDDERWLSLRYDLTAPLARYVAENFDALPKPFRRYQWGPVWRNEKPGPGRYRQFLQMDADTVGTANPAADAEMCMLAADALEALGIGECSTVRVSNRKVLEGLREAISVEQPIIDIQWLAVLRSADKLDRLGADDVHRLLTVGRKDESGDFTKGANLSAGQADNVLRLLGFSHSAGVGYVRDPLLRPAQQTNDAWLDWLTDGVELGPTGAEGVEELRQIATLAKAAGYDDERIAIDPSIVRGLEYYTGPVFEAELTFETTDDDGRPVRFGSVGGGGRYDDLVARFRGQPVPATGFSIGISRLYAALAHLGRHEADAVPAPVVILAMDREAQAGYQAMARELRAAGVRAEVYLGTSGMKAQMKYADRRGAPVVVIEGTVERGEGVVTVKDLIEGARLSEGIEDRAEWTAGRPAQETVARADMVAKTLEYLARHGNAPKAAP